MFEGTESDGQPLPAHTSCDVAIVGYGPVGMVLAGLLAQRGVSVVVVERWPTRYPLSRAGHCDSETMRTFQTLGIAEAVELVARPMLLWSLVNAEMEVLATIKLGQGGGGWKDSYLSYQPEIEAIFDRRAHELGVRVYMGMSADRLEHGPDGATLIVSPSDADGNGDPTDERTIEASYVIGADGARSFVRAALGIERLDLGFRSLDQLVLDFEHNDHDVDLPQLPEVYQVLDVDRPLLAGRWSGSRHSRFEFAAKEGETREFLESDETCWNFLARWNITPADGRIDRRAVYSFESRLAQTWRVGRVLLIGDAAHTMPPFMGQGMCSGMRDAINLTWKLAAVLAGEADDSLLDTYQSEREPHVRGLIELSMEVGGMILIRDPEAGRERDEMLRSGAVPTAPVFPRLGSGIVVPTEGTESPDGRSAPQARVALDGRVDRLDEFHGPGWKIISRHTVPPELFNERQRYLLTSLGVEIMHVSRGPGPGYYVDIDGEYDLWFRTTGRKAFLSRPDNYVFGAVRSVDELPALLDELADSLAAHGWHDVASSALTS